MNVGQLNVVAGILESLVKLYVKDYNDYGQVNQDLVLPLKFFIAKF